MPSERIAEQKIKKVKIGHYVSGITSGETLKDTYYITSASYSLGKM